MEQEANIPEFLSKKLESQYGKEITKKILQGYTYKRPVTFRVNTLKAYREKIQQTLKENQIEYSNVEWNKEAFIIKNEEKEKIQQLDIYEKRRNISTKLIIYVTTDNIKPKRKHGHTRYDSSTTEEKPPR